MRCSGDTLVAAFDGVPECIELLNNGSRGEERSKQVGRHPFDVDCDDGQLAECEFTVRGFFVRRQIRLAWRDCQVRFWPFAN